MPAAHHVDPVARTRAMLEAEIAGHRLDLAHIDDAETRAEIEAELERAESHLASLNMCFV